MAFERTFQFLRNPTNAPVKVELDGEPARVGAVLDVVGAGLGITLATDGEGVTTCTVTSGETFDPTWGNGVGTISADVLLIPVARTQTLTQAALVASVSGSVTVTVKRYTPSGGALGAATTLGTVTLTSAVYNRVTGLEWAVTAGDVLEFTPSGISSITKLQAKIA
jgi:hypothetical protein